MFAYLFAVVLTTIPINYVAPRFSCTLDECVTQIYNLGDTQKILAVKKICDAPLKCGTIATRSDQFNKFIDPLTNDRNVYNAWIVSSDIPFADKLANHIIEGSRVSVHEVTTNVNAKKQIDRYYILNKQSPLYKLEYTVSEDPTSAYYTKLTRASHPGTSQRQITDSQGGKRKGAKKASTKVLVLGRERVVTKVGRKSMVTYKGVQMGLTEARQLERELKKKKK